MSDKKYKNITGKPYDEESYTNQTSDRPSFNFNIVNIRKNVLRFT